MSNSRIVATGAIVGILLALAGAWQIYRLARNVVANPAATERDVNDESIARDNAPQTVTKFVHEPEGASTAAATETEGGITGQAAPNDDNTDSTTTATGDAEDPPIPQGASLGGWLSEHGLDFVSRTYSYPAAPELTEEVAIDFTRRTLEASGHDMSKLAPVEYRWEFSEDETERLFSRNRIDPNRGKVLWGPLPGGRLADGATWTFNVNVWKDDEGVHCRAYRGK